ncbi:cupin domain-containing protein [Deltaproteobacteria bacterium Smac51]|nr:cupin domain-containing protein [Deltaproteobacteria bacterium Smac51]
MFVFNSEVPSKKIFEGMERKILSHSPQLMTCEVRLTGGTKVPEHQHPHHQCCYVVSGRLRANVAGEVHEIGPGDSVFLDENVPHAMEALEDTRLLDIFSPRRDDFLE